MVRPRTSYRIRLLPHVALAPFAADRRRELERRGGGCPQHEDVAVLIGCRFVARWHTHERRTAPDLPAQPLIEALAARAQRAELVTLRDELVDVAHQRAAVPAACSAGAVATASTYPVRSGSPATWMSRSTTAA